MRSAIWTPTTHGSGFLIDAKGLIATTRTVVSTPSGLEVQVSSDVKVAARLLAADAMRDVAILWIDPASRSFYVFLSNRVHPNGKGSVTALQVALGTLSARAAGYTAPVVPRVRFITGGADASNGIDSLIAALQDERFFW